MPLHSCEPSPIWEDEERISAVREIWAKNCEGLTQAQQEKLWEVLLEFKDIFALNESEVGYLVLGGTPYRHGRCPSR